MASVQYFSVKIILLTNEPSYSIELKHIITSLGYSVTTTTNNEDFKEYLSDSEYQLAILDINRNNTAESLQLVKSLDLKNKMPFIILSEITDHKHIDLAIELGVSFYLAKIPSKAQLKISIHSALGNPAYDWVSFGSNNTRFQKGDIYCIVADGHLSNIYLRNGHKINVNNSIRKVLQAINYPPLVQVHRSYCVNIEKVEAYSHSTIYLPFKIQHHGKYTIPDCVPISRAKTNRIISYLENRQ